MFMTLNRRYEDWKKSFKSSIDAYENEQNRLLALQLTGIDFEKANWQARLNNLSSFVSSWNALQAKMTNTTASSGGGGGSVSAPSMPSGSVTGGSGSVGVSNPKTLALKEFLNKQFGANLHVNGRWDNATTEAVKQMQKRIGLTSPNGLYNKPTYIALTRYMNRTVGSAADVPAYASGVASVGENQIALVGENPNSELVIGSKLNGSLTKLSEGSGVVKSKSTNTLAGLLNSINGGGASCNTYEGNRPISIASLNISVPNVTNGEEFSKYLTNNLRNDINQKNKSRK